MPESPDPLRPRVRLNRPIKTTDEKENIAEGSTLIREAAGKLASRIEHFEKHLNTIPGRVDTECFGHHPDADSPQAEALMSLVLKLHRDGKCWVLSYGKYTQDINEDPDCPISYARLKDAPLKIKLAAVRMFPKMLEAIKESQRTMAEEINRAVAEYDDFAAWNEIGKKEDK